ncbi:MAG: class I SAM-dependent methyltransferase, partial [Acetobacteraceae bacterium]
GRLLELLAPRATAAAGIDLSREMLALARARLGAVGLARVSLRLADAARLPFADAAFDVVTLSMMLHYAEDPAEVIAEAARVLAPGGTLAIVELAAHGDDALVRRLAHRWPGFAPPQLEAWLRAAGLTPARHGGVAGAIPVLLFAATRGALGRTAARPAHELA